jgi:hypothetical protein
LIYLYRKVGPDRHSVQDLFASIPQLLRNEINHLDFLDFLQALSLTGHARETADGRFELCHPDHTAIRIRIR